MPIRLRRLAVLALAAGALDAQQDAAASRPASALSAALALQDASVAVAEAALPSVVTVRAYVRGHLAASGSRDDRGELDGWGASDYNADYDGFGFVGAASGFVVAQNGDVLTCYHALRKADGSPADLIDVESHDGVRVIAELVGAEPTVNLAILRPVVAPQGRSASFKVARFGDSDALKTGQLVFGVGDPAGPEKYFALGTFVSRPSRDCYQEQLSAFYLQAALVVPAQAYGGPLLNLAGEVVGVLSPRRPKPGVEAAEPRTGLELALPSKIVVGLYDSLKQARSTRSPWLGFAIMSREEVATSKGVEAFNAMAKPRHGVLIESVFKPSPAAAADIRPGDFLVFFDRLGVFTPVDFQRYLYLAGIGKKVKLELFRNGEKIERELTIEARPPEAMPK
jgi:serine protease Do